MARGVHVIGRLLALLLFATYSAPLTAAGTKSGCLYAFTAGDDDTPISPCDAVDSRGLANDPDVRKTIRALGLDGQKIRFRGCTNTPFFAAQEAAGTGHGMRYVINYPSELQETYIAPITHELAHVLQMEMAGGLVPLREEFESRRVELGADFLTGIIFKQALSHVNLNTFQTNLAVIGKYRERDDRAHGTPEQRTGAFRSGVFMQFDDINRDMRKANLHFQRNVYGRVIAD